MNDQLAVTRSQSTPSDASVRTVRRTRAVGRCSTSASSWTIVGPAAGTGRSGGRPGPPPPDTIASAATPAARAAAAARARMRRGGRTRPNLHRELVETTTVAGGVSADWIGPAAEALARHAERELEALVGVSSPSGD